MVEHSNNVIKKLGEEVLGRTSRRKCSGGKETWWWSNEVQAVKVKKDVKKNGKSLDSKRTGNTTCCVKKK